MSKEMIDEKLRQVRVETANVLNGELEYIFDFLKPDFLIGGYLYSDDHTGDIRVFMNEEYKDVVCLALLNIVDDLVPDEYKFKVMDDEERN